MKTLETNKTKTLKTLYFEGAGMFQADSSKNTIGNCRIRTAFTNNENKQIYLEISAAPKYKGRELAEYKLRINFCYYITDDENSYNNNRMKYHNDAIKNYNYSIKDITKWINNNLNCNFDNIEVLPDLAGYRVHKEKRGCYNLVDNFIYDIELTKKREQIYQYFYELEKSEGKKYPNFSLWVNKENKNILHLLRHFNGYNKHWSINTDVENWLDSLIECKLGKYAC